MRLAHPVMDDRELQAISEVLESGNLTQGPKATEFGKLLANYVGTKHGLTASSCTTALHLSLVALGIKSGDEVIVPGFTFPATANVVFQLGAIPVLADIDRNTFCMDPNSLEEAVSEKTRAVIPVHAFGLTADMDAINAIAKKYGLAVLEDAACALGATYRGRKAGSLGDVACFSFHPRKVITTGEGGAITTSDATLFSKLALLSSHGGRKGELYFDFDEPGFNYRLSDLNAAIGIVQMSRLDEILEKRRTFASTYGTLLESFSNVKTPIEPLGYTHSFQSYVVMLETSVNRDQVIRYMRAHEVEVTLGTYALHHQTVFQDQQALAGRSLPNSDLAGSQALTLPLHSQLTVADLERVVSTLNDALREQ